MSVVERDKIDGIGKSKDNSELILLITDHLEWEDEQEHLMILQNKINAYLGFIESRQYRNIYPNDYFESSVIEIHFKNSISENGLKFLDVVADCIKKYNIKIRLEVS